jgi:hypothetical protein
VRATALQKAGGSAEGGSCAGAKLVARYVLAVQRKSACFVVLLLYAPTARRCFKPRWRFKRGRATP